ncbi:hypothetical protein LOD99_9592 [Oopsacas minuta]|uniref:F-box domain-containing protein n=1 Tax=Oopsacas minuta TaxID=111878 RepID=A0AAV7KNG4_9METZ|nr:hypothetical protein LOD99_9592 [Oopsacas minuta]
MAESNSELVKQNPAHKPLLLLELPRDILIKIVIVCTPRSLSALSVCCKELYVLCNTDIIWKYIISYRYRDVSVFHLLPDLSNKSLYHKYYYFLCQLRGLWVLHLDPYNIVISIAQSSTNPLEFIGKMPGLRHVKFMNNPLEYHEIAKFSLYDSSFKISKRNVTFSCSGRFEEGERVDPLKIIRLSKSACKNLVCEINNPKLKDLGSRDVYSIDRYSDLNSSYNNTTCELNLTKVVVCKVHTDEPQLLSPGVYRGDYFIHGIELLLVYYQDGMIFVRKLAGDSNIPGDKISIRCQHLNKLNTKTPVYVDITRGGRILCSLDSDLYPKKFIVSYTGEGQIADFGYLSSCFCPGTMYVADENTFVYIWDTLGVCTLFRKCEDLSSEFGLNSSPDSDTPTTTSREIYRIWEYASDAPPVNFHTPNSVN